jgi:hypothetical protein
MKAILMVFLGVAVLAALLAASQQAGEQPDLKLPSGKSQREEILKSEHEKSLRDVSELRDLAEGLEEDLKKSDYHVLSISALKKAEEIEKLAKRIKGRLRRF